MYSPDQGWADAVPSELHYFSLWLDDKVEPGAWAHRSSPKNVWPDVVPLLPDKDSCEILDVGSGPVSGMGTLGVTQKVSIVQADPLDGQYTEMLASRGLTCPYEHHECHAEDLESYFQGRTFDVVFLHNSLDHCSDPKLALRNIRAVATHAIYMRHYMNIAEHTGYEGFHRWNYDHRYDRAVLWNKTGIVDVGGSAGIDPFIRVFPSADENPPQAEAIFILQPH